MEHGGKLVILGWLIVIAGLIAALVSYQAIDVDAYENSKKVYEEISDNEFARAEYISEKAMYTAGITNTLLSVVGGVVGGFILVGFGLTLDAMNRRTNSAFLEN